MARAAADQLSPAERDELRDYLIATTDVTNLDVSESAQRLVRSRAAELEADPSVGLTVTEAMRRIRARLA